MINSQPTVGEVNDSYSGGDGDIENIGVGLIPNQDHDDDYLL